MDDYNGKIWIGINAYFPSCIGKFSSGKSTNPNRKYLLNSTVNWALKITNTFYKKRKNGKWTWQSPNENTKNKIDCLLVNDTRAVKEQLVQLSEIRLSFLPTTKQLLLKNNKKKKKKTEQRSRNQTRDNKKLRKIRLGKVKFWRHRESPEPIITMNLWG